MDATAWAWPIARAAGMTVLLSVCAFGGGLVIATGVAGLKLSRFGLLRWIGTAYTALLRGVPDLLIIYLLFFGGSQAARTIAQAFGYTGYFELQPFLVGAVALSIVSGAFGAETLRGAYLAVPRGQFEAARSLGLSRLQCLGLVVAPQLLRYALPGLGNLWLVTLKETSLVSVVGVTETMRQASVSAGSTKQPFTFYLIAAFVFLTLALSSIRGFRAAEASLAVPGHARA
jgi:octopine/nopaline transport system permease protein